MRVVVAGAAGFIGSKLSARLMDRGHQVIGIDAFLAESYPASLKRENVATLANKHPSFQLVEVDLRTAHLPPIIEGCDAIVNQAAMAGLFPSWRDLDLYLSCNVAAVGRLLDAAIACETPRFIQISTSSVYGRNAVGNEDQPRLPISPYGVTKLAAETLMGAYSENYGLPGMILRYFSVYGPGQRPDMAYSIFSEALIDGAPITIYGDGTQSRNNVYIDDCIDGTIAALEEFKAFGVYNIAGPKPIRLLDAIEVLADEIGTAPNITFTPDAPGDQYQTHGDISRAVADFRYNPTVEPEHGLRQQARWHLARRASRVASDI